jgi:long-subunit fatty acid transport protein
VAFLENAAAMFHNPANLQGIERVALTLAFSGIIANLGAPIDGPDDHQTTGPSAAPTFLIGAGVRVHDRVAVGLGAYIYTGYGGDYNDVDSIQGVPLFDPMDQSVALFVGELSVPVGVEITDELDAGIALRLPYAQQTVSVHQELFFGNYRPVEQDTSGIGKPGVLAGLTYRPTPTTSIGAAYRSKVKISMDGTTTVRITTGGDPIVVDTDTAWYVPHMARAGVAQWLLDRRLMLAGEFRVQFHEEANKSQVFTQDFDGFETIEAPLEWKNVFNFIVAGEYWVTPRVAVRAALSGGNGATPPAAVQFFTTPPGLLLAPSAGAGMRLDDFDIDFGLSYGFASEDVPPQEGRCQPGDTVKVGCPGEYTVQSLTIGASLTYRL